MDFLMGSAVLPTLLSSHWLNSTSLTQNTALALDFQPLSDKNQHASASRERDGAS